MLRGDEILTHAHLTCWPESQAVHTGSWQSSYQDHIMPATLKLADLGTDLRVPDLMKEIYDETNKMASSGAYSPDPYACRTWALDALLLVRKRFKVKLLDFAELYWSQYMSVVPLYQKFDSRLQWKNNKFAEVTKKDLTIPGYAEKPIGDQMDYLRWTEAPSEQETEDWEKEQIQATEEPYRSLGFQTWEDLIHGWVGRPEMFLAARLDSENVADSTKFPGRAARPDVRVH